MKTNFDCPSCSENSWLQGCKYRYPTNNYIDPRSLNRYNAKFIAVRHHILSYLWFANKDEIEITSLFCRKCGFICYTPRPTEIDLQIKYGFLNGVEKVGANNNPNTLSHKILDKRASRLFSIITSQKKNDKLSILDYGGGDGGLLRYFSANRSQCYLIDFNTKVKPGIKRLGSTIDDLPPEKRFNVVVCSHVLEHVCYPVDILKKLGDFLVPGGIIYVEVPAEVWKDVPLRHDPVTHINFFSKESLRTTIYESGFEIEKIKYDYQPYGEKYKRVVWAIIACNDEIGFISPRKPNKTMQFFNPGVVRTALRKIEDRWLKYKDKCIREIG